ncbi:hypothetical protein RMATCC62417_01809 [Rhizopus microsporus]|nr:hypothetical protein RMATCC62417_01809 [Rhizopus microsporus]
MKVQGRLEFRTRRNVTRRAEVISNNALMEGKAFRAAEDIILKPTVSLTRKSARIASKTLKQIELPFKKDEQLEDKKRKNDTEETISNKKQKTEVNIPKEIITDELQKETKEQVTEQIQKEKVTVQAQKETVTEQVQEEEKAIVQVQEEERVVVVEEKFMKSSNKEMTTTMLDKSDNIVKGSHDTDNLKDISTRDNNEMIPPIEQSSKTQDDNKHHTSSDAPFKTYVSLADKQRIEDEKLIITSVRKALDIVITDRVARNQPTLYHQTEAILRNITGRNVKMSHICKIMYLAPRLYSVEAKELRTYGGKINEDFLIEFGKEWRVPLVGKDLQLRADMLREAVDRYFNEHPEHDATVPEAPLPRLRAVVNKDEWEKQANLPQGIKKLLEAHKAVKQERIEQQKPKPTPQGSVKERFEALRARLASKKK